MKARAVILPDGQISIITQEGTFEEGKAAVQRLMAALGAEGVEVTIDPAKDFEQHRHDNVKPHVHLDVGA